MRKHGHDLEVGLLRPQTMALISQISNDFREGHRVLVETVTSLSRDGVQLTASQRWRLPDLCDFLDLLESDGVAMPDFWTAVQVDHEQMRASWMRCMGLAADLDLALLAEEARAALVEINDHHRSDPLLELFYASPGGWAQDLNPGRLGSDETQSLLGLLTAASEWIAQSAVRLLWNAQTPGLAEEITDLLPAVSPSRRFLLAVLCSVVSEDRGVRLRAFFDSEDPALRRAAAAASRGEDADPEIMALRARALLDGDATIRIAAGATTLEGPDVPAPRHWSCRWCAEFNELDADDCRACDEGTRPRAGDE